MLTDEERENEKKLEIEKKKPKLLKSDIIIDKKERAFELAKESMEKFSVEKDISEYIKQKFDKEFLPTWQCVVGIKTYYYFR